MRQKIVYVFVLSLSQLCGWLNDAQCDVSFRCTIHYEFYGTVYKSRHTSEVGKVRPAGQIRPVSSIHPARGGSSVLTLDSAWKTYRMMSDCFHAECDLVAH